MIKNIKMKKTPTNKPIENYNLVFILSKKFFSSSLNKFSSTV